MGYDPLYGARPLKRLIQKELYDLIAKKIISGELVEGAKIFTDYQDGTVRIMS
jgi:ATP-dependent Clp protease ATP-binding subunit ClpB